MGFVLQSCESLDAANRYPCSGLEKRVQTGNKLHRVTIVSYPNVEKSQKILKIQKQYLKKSKNLFSGTKSYFLQPQKSTLQNLLSRASYRKAFFFTRRKIPCHKYFF